MLREIKSITLNNHVQLQYVEQGDTSGIPVLLLHGLSDSWHSFDLVLPHLPTSIRAFAPAQRGHGDSSRPEGEYSADEFAGDVEAFMDALDLDAAVVAGHSMGSAVARRVAIRSPERALGVVLVSSFGVPGHNPVVRELWNEVSEMTDPVDPDFVREFQESTLARSVPQGFFETVLQESLKVPARVWRGVVGSDIQANYLADVDHISAPTLVAWGDQDEICRRGEQETLVAEIPDARLIEYPGVGHGIHWEEPEQFASDLVRFVETEVKQ